jgi:polyisoprenoid-binding protein YceI
MTRLAAVPLTLLALLAVCGQVSAQAVELTAPAGIYKLDPNHRSLVGKVQHLNLAPYSVRFVKFDVTLNLDPKKIAASSVEVTVDPTSVRTDYTGDYKGTHKDTPFDSFEHALSTGPMFFNSGQFPAITFKSTKVQSQGKGRYKVTGDLTMLGQTRPLTLDATLTGAIAEHPRSKAPALGFSATGTFKRSEFGMKIGIGKFLGDDVTVTFDGELIQQVAPPPA